MKNYERLKDMSVEEMAHQIEGIFSDGLDTLETDEQNCFGKMYLNYDECNVSSCHKCFITWLNQEEQCN